MSQNSKILLREALKMNYMNKFGILTESLNFNWCKPKSSIVKLEENR